MMRLSDALRAHALRIEEAGWPTALSRDLHRAAEQIECLEAMTKEPPADGEGPAPHTETELAAAANRKARQEKPALLAAAMEMFQNSKREPKC